MAVADPPSGRVNEPDSGQRADAEHDAPREPQELTFFQHAVAFVRELLGVVVGAIIVASLLRGFVGQMFLIPSISMEDTLQISDRVLVEKLSDVQRGQVIVFEDPGGWLTGVSPVQRGPVGRFFQFVGVLPDPSTDHLIKRVIGVAGDHVVCCDAEHRIVVNDQPLDEAGYLKGEGTGGGAATRASDIRFDVVVPDHHFFVLGDNRAHSRDSRCHLNDTQAGVVRGANAFVAEDLVVGRALAVVWPARDLHRLPIPATFVPVPAGRSPAPGSPEITAGPEATC